MKSRVIAFALFSAFLMQGALAEDQCIVLGFHEPHTQIYDGPTWCRGVYIKNIVVHGPFRAMRSTFTGTATVSGPMRSDDSIFDSVTENSATAEKIKLCHNSKIKGNADFQGPAGEVIVSVTSSVDGKVINGKLIHR
ncbi:MAG: hypothetical protein A3E82_09145 [Gammaproteobacteria bacterium RIFCSPHIGHO2_12_FULL_38_11]|nr:MAG: hypothetical protein A3E82_09145 [Gammaproteobacteria bacterium RIFCSPHIGHO2_12_FULL_38_11]